MAPMTQPLAITRASSQEGRKCRSASIGRIAETKSPPISTTLSVSSFQYAAIEAPTNKQMAAHAQLLRRIGDSTQGGGRRSRKTRRVAAAATCATENTETAATP